MSLESRAIVGFLELKSSILFKPGILRHCHSEIS